jgi:hypothetical protein
MSGQQPNFPPIPNPYSAPPSAAAPGVACPRCGAPVATKVSYCWWGGALGPRLFNVVKCTQCRMQYNGKTGGSLTKAIIIYHGVSLALVGVLAYVWFQSH